MTKFRYSESMDEKKKRERDLITANDAPSRVAAASQACMSRGGSIPEFLCQLTNMLIDKSHYINKNCIIERSAKS